jgi:hypothetical protein
MKLLRLAAGASSPELPGRGLIHRGQCAWRAVNRCAIIRDAGRQRGSS